MNEDKYMIHFEIPGLPPTINSIGSNWRKINRVRGEWKDLVWYAVRNFLPSSPLVRAKLVCVRHSSNTPDFDGLVSSFKAPIDGLVEAGVLSDDNMEVIGMPDFRWQKANKDSGKIEMLVQEVD